MNKLKNNIIDQLSAQILILENLPRFIKLNCIKSWLDDSCELLSDDIVVSLNKRVLNNNFTITGLVFLDSSAESSDKYLNESIKVLNKISAVAFNNCVFKCKELKNSIFISTFKECRFLYDWTVIVQGNSLNLIDEFDSIYSRCEFSGKTLLYKNNIDSEIVEEYSSIFHNCIIKSIIVYHLHIKTNLLSEFLDLEIRTIEEVFIQNSILDFGLMLQAYSVNKINLSSSKISELSFSLVSAEKIVISDCIVSGNCSFSNANIKRLYISGVEFESGCSLSSAEINELMLVNCSFSKVLNFNSIKVKKEISLEALHFNISPEFIYCNFGKSAIASSERETWRIMKHALDGVGNRVEAGEYYALEMQAYQRELKHKKWCHPERVLLAANHVISNHGQSYARPAGLLILVMCLTGLLIANQQYQWLTTPDLLLPLTRILNAFSQGFLPIHAIVGEDKKGISFLLFLSSIFTSVFAWHFLVAIRRHSKK